MRLAAHQRRLPVQVLDWTVPPSELVQAVDNRPRALLLYSGQALAAPLRHQLPRLASTSAVPLLLAGPPPPFITMNSSCCRASTLPPTRCRAEQRLRELDQLLERCPMRQLIWLGAATCAPTTTPP